MKLPHPSSSRRSGFTLVELLVVIGIIAILAGVVMAGVTSAIKAAKRAKTLVVGNQLVTAVQTYYTDYMVYPAPPNTTADTIYTSTDATKWGAMMVALCGGVDPGAPTQGQVAVNANTIPNTRQVPYLSPSHGDLDTTVTPAVLKTPFPSQAGKAQYYFMAIDTNYDNVLGGTGAGAVSIPDFSAAKPNSALPKSTNGISTGVAVWSNCDQDPAGGSTSPNFWVHTY